MRLMPMGLTVAAGAVALLAFAPQAVSAPNPDGERLYSQKCAMCHRLNGSTSLGPSLRGVYGRKAGQASGYAYSAAMLKSGLSWNAQTLDNYLASPTKVVRGGKMVLAVPGAGDRAAIIGYLETLD